MTSVLFVGDVRRYTRTEQRLRALQALARVRVVPTRLDDGSAPGTKKDPLLDRALARLGRPRDRAGASTATRDALGSAEFDVLWVEKAPALDPRLVQSASAVRVFVSEDDMAQRHNQTRSFRAALPHYDIVFTTKPRNLGADGLARLGARRVELVPKCFDPELHRPLELTPEEQLAFGSDVAFVGTFEEQRAADLSRLADAGVDVRVWGNGWRGRRVSPRLRVEGRPVVGEDYARVLSAAAVQLCFVRHANQDQHTGRSVEIPAAGAFLLAERTGEHLDLFEEGREAEFFLGFDELLGKVHGALADPERRASIAARGRARVLADERSHPVWARRMLALALEAR